MPAMIASLRKPNSTRAERNPLGVVKTKQQLISALKNLGKI